MLHPLTILSLGPGDPKYLTLETAETLRTSSCLVLRTRQHPVADWLEHQGISFQSLDALYEQSEDFDTLNTRITQKITELLMVSPVSFAVPDALSDRSVAELMHALPEDTELHVLPGVTFPAQALSMLPAGCMRSTMYRVLTAEDVLSLRPDPSMPQLILEIDTRERAGLVKLQLQDLYPEEMQVYFLTSAVQKDPHVKCIPLYQLDREETYDHTVCVYIPGVDLLNRTRHTFPDLMEIMQILRGEQGCPWDRKQTHETLRPYLLEEAYEAIGAIDQKDDDALCEELGDVLLQIAFHASIAMDHGSFSDTDIASAICQKMIHRHPHVFAGATTRAEDTWDELKKEEHGLKTQGDLLQDVTRALPALTRAVKVQKRAAKVGFDFSGPTDAMPRLTEQVSRLSSSLEDSIQALNLAGDLLFTCVQVLRLSGLDPEDVLTRATDRFIDRFCRMEKAVMRDGKNLETLTRQEMDVYWSGVLRQEA